jgi:ABC-type transport system substrate-binding protein
MRRRSIIGGIIALAVAGAGCGGGGGGSPAPTFAASATPTPAPTPTALPGGPLTLSQSALAFTAAGQTATVTVNEPAYAGTVAPDASGCTAVAGVTPASAAAVPAMFTITAQGAGSCSLAFLDGRGQRATVTIGVTITQGALK